MFSPSHILIATSNTGKLQEIQNFLHDVNIQNFFSLSDFPQVLLPEETGKTYEENALQKAKYVFAHTHIPTIAEDSGIIVTALEGELGTKTRRWGAGENASDEEWLTYFLRCMKEKKDRSATFYSAIAYVSENDTRVFLGTCVGNLLAEPVLPLQRGIPLSSLFVPLGATKAFSQMSTEEKSQYSHRGKALKQLKLFFHA